MTNHDRVLVALFCCAIVGVLWYLLSGTILHLLPLLVAAVVLWYVFRR